MATVAVPVRQTPNSAFSSPVAASISVSASDVLIIEKVTGVWCDGFAGDGKSGPCYKITSDPLVQSNAMNTGSVRLIVLNCAFHFLFFKGACLFAEEKFIPHVGQWKAEGSSW